MLPGVSGGAVVSAALVLGDDMVECVSTEKGRRLLTKQGGTQPETKIKHQVRDYLSLRGWFVRWNLQGLGCYPGLPDMTATKDGRTVEIEVKTARGRQSARQMEYQDALEVHGGAYWLVHSLEDLIEYVEGER